MHGSVSIDGRIASNSAATSGQEVFVQTASGNILPGPEWFKRLAHSLWPDKPGAWIRSLTGFPERTCRSAASGDTEVSSPMLYALLRGEQGGRVLALLMHGCTAQWWLDMERERKLAAVAQRFIEEITSRE